MIYSPSVLRIARLQDRAARLYDAMREQLSDGRQAKTLALRYSLRQAAEMAGRSDMTVRRAIETGALPSPDRGPSNRLGLALAEVNRMRDQFGTRPGRAETDDPVILGVQTFKGGVGKSTIAVHTAQYLALQGYRVLLVDADPQASTTGTFGYNPEADIAEGDTLLPFLEPGGTKDDLTYAIRPTYFDGLDLIPACLALYNAEYHLAASSAGADRFERLRAGLSTVAHAYDVVVLDPPPALGMISLNALRAANALLIPTPPSSIDYASTVSFLQMLSSVLETMEEHGARTEHAFVQLLATKVDENKSAHGEMRDAMQEMFAGDIFTTALLDSSEFDNASIEMRTVYEYAGPVSRTYKRCRANLDRVMGELELAIRKTWPSHASRLRAEGVA